MCQSSHKASLGELQNCKRCVEFYLELHSYIHHSTECMIILEYLPLLNAFFFLNGYDWTVSIYSQKLYSKLKKTGNSLCAFPLRVAFSVCISLYLFIFFHASYSKNFREH